MSPKAKENWQGIGLLLLIFFSPGIAEGLWWLIDLIPFSGPITFVLFVWGAFKLLSFILKEMMK